MRVAALCAEPEQRSETKAIVDRALALERELWSGEPASQTSGAEGIPTAAETAVAVEDLARAILRDAACGHLGGDLRSKMRNREYVPLHEAVPVLEQLATALDFAHARGFVHGDTSLTRPKRMIRLLSRTTRTLAVALVVFL